MMGMLEAARGGSNLESSRLDAIGRGIQYLVTHQNKDGSWGTARRTKDLNIFAPVPGAHHAFRSATTALAIEALIETLGADATAKDRAALEKGEAWLLRELPRLRRADAIAIYNVWGHAYGLQALAAMHRRAAGNPERQSSIREAMQGQIDLLGRYESVDGGWGYYDFRAGARKPTSDANSFTTATVLLAFDAARREGMTLPEPLVRRAVDSIQRQRNPDNTYHYYDQRLPRPMWEINRRGGSLGRSQACNLALRRWGDATITDAVLEEWLQHLVERNGWLSMARKRPVPHESWFLVAAYFFYYGHYHAALCLGELSPERSAPLKERLLEVLLPLQEKDGSWWDFPFYDYHQPYGTAYALLALSQCGPPRTP